MENINNPYKYFNKASQVILNSLREKSLENMSDDELEDSMYNHDCKQEKCNVCAEYLNRKNRHIDLEVDTAIEQSVK